MFLQRQIAGFSAEGEKESLADATRFPYRTADVLPKYTLVIGNGDYTSDYIRLDASDSYTVQLPESYTDAARLSCAFRSNAICKVTIVSPVHGTSEFLLKGTNGTTDGEHLGVLMWQGRVTSITLEMAAGADPALIDYFLFVIPDLESASSWQLGQTAFGVAGGEA